MYYLPVMNHLYSISEAGEIKPTSDSTVKFKHFPSHKSAENAIKKKMDEGFALHTYLIIEKSDNPNTTRRYKH